MGGLFSSTQPNKKKEYCPKGTTGKAALQLGCITQNTLELKNIDLYL